MNTQDDMEPLQFNFEEDDLKQFLEFWNIYN